MAGRPLLYSRGAASKSCIVATGTWGQYRLVWFAHARGIVLEVDQVRERPVRAVTQRWPMRKSIAAADEHVRYGVRARLWRVVAAPFGTSALEEVLRDVAVVACEACDGDHDVPCATSRAASRGSIMVLLLQRRQQLCTVYKSRGGRE